MTEQEFILEMLCSLPLDLLQKRNNNEQDIPEWLKRTEKMLIQQALEHYNDEEYIETRRIQAECL